METVPVAIGPKYNYASNDTLSKYDNKDDNIARDALKQTLLISFNEIQSTLVYVWKFPRDLILTRATFLTFLFYFFLFYVKSVLSHELFCWDVFLGWYR